MKLFVKDKDFYRQVKRIAIPIVLQSMVTAGVGMMDTFMVGSLGEAELSAISLTNQFINVFMIMCYGLGFGAAVLTAQFFGSKNIPALKKIVTIMLRVTVVLSAVFMVVTLIFPAQVMQLYTPNEAIIEQGVLYFEISGFIYLFMALSLTLTAILRTIGQVKLPLVTSIIVFIVNVFLNYVFIFGKFGVAPMGVRGAALGTLCTRILEASIIGGYFFIKESLVRYRIKDFFISCKEYISVYISICVPVLISDTMLAFGNNMVAVIMGHIGVSFVAANAIISQILRMTITFNQGVSNSSSIITGNTLGAGNRKKAYKQGITFGMLSLIVGVLGAFVVLMVTPLVIGMFEITEETRNVANQLKYAMAIMFVFQTLASTLTKGVLRGGGDTKFLMVADILFLWLASIPLGYLTSLVWALPAFWIFIALRIDYFIKTIWCTVRLVSGKWLKQIDDSQEADGESLLSVPGKEKIPAV